MRKSGLRPLAAVLGFLLAPVVVPTARCDEPRLSISGYDPVAYFTDGRPVQSSPEFEYIWHKLRWRFSSEEHRALFVKDPEHYAPQYDGYCAMGTSNDAAAHKDTVDPEAWPSQIPHSSTCNQKRGQGSFAIDQLAPTGLIAASLSARRVRSCARS